MLHYFWNDKQDAVLREGYETWDHERLEAAINGLSPDGRTYNRLSILRRAMTLGLSRRRQNEWTPEQDEFLRINYEGMPMPELLAGLAERGSSRTSSSVHGHAFRMKLSRPRSAPPIPKKKEKVARPKAVKPVKKLQPVVKAPKPVKQPVQRVVQAPKAPPVVLQTIVADEHDPVQAKVSRSLDQARAMLFRGSAPGAVAEATRLPMREVFRLVGEVREMRRSASRSLADAEVGA
jgi:hypothetical protein